MLFRSGHVVPVLYSVLAHKGFFDLSELDTLRQFKSILQGHPNSTKTPGIDCSSGSLGQGLSISNGIAFALRRQNIDALFNNAPQDCAKHAVLPGVLCL